MYFNSALFLFFISALLPLYAALSGSRARKYCLLVASYIFYANWDYRYLPLIATSTLVDYFVGGRMAIDAEAAENAIRGLAERLNRSPADTAFGILTIANELMIRAIQESQA